MEDLNPTTRMFPRRLRDAFRDDPENTQWWYPPEKHVSFWDIVVGGTGICLWISLAYYFAS